MSALDIHMFPCLTDNYGYLVHDVATGATVAIDTPDAARYSAELAARGWRLTHIFNTHHHGDHAGGNLALKRETGCTIVGPRADAARIPGIDVQVGDGDEVVFGSRRVCVFDTPGHTRGHVVYLFADDGAAFVGDTLFAMGCGRMFEGTPGQMWSSLQKIAGWPAATRLYCAHEYTKANVRFALTMEPGNPALVERAAEVERLRAAGRPTIPTTVELELRTNPFLRPGSPEIQAQLGLRGADAVEVFARTRAAKDVF